MAKKSAPAVEELEDDGLELVEDAEDEDDPKPAKGKGKSAKTSAPAKKEKAETNGMGAAWLADHVNETLGTELTPANVRVILRKMAADGDIEREVGTDRARYSFTGENDRTVKAVIKRVRAGEVEEAKKERLSAAKAGKKAKDEDEAEEETKPAKGKKAKAAAEEAPAPKPKATRRRSS